MDGLANMRYARVNTARKRIHLPQTLGLALEYIWAVQHWICGSHERAHLDELRSVHDIKPM